MTGSWIGLTDQQDEGNFTWVDGTPLLYHFWGYGQPDSINGNQHCTVNYQTGWHNTGCNAQRQYLCKHPAATIN